MLVPKLFILIHQLPKIIWWCQLSLQYVWYICDKWLLRVPWRIGPMCLTCGGDGQVMVWYGTVWDGIAWYCIVWDGQLMVKLWSGEARRVMEWSSTWIFVVEHWNIPRGAKKCTRSISWVFRTFKFLPHPPHQKKLFLQIGWKILTRAFKPYSGSLAEKHDFWILLYSYTRFHHSYFFCLILIDKYDDYHLATMSMIFLTLRAFSSSKNYHLAIFSLIFFTLMALSSPSSLFLFLISSSSTSSSSVFINSNHLALKMEANKATNRQTSINPLRKTLKLFVGGPNPLS